MNQCSMTWTNMGLMFILKVLMSIERGNAALSDVLYTYDTLKSEELRHNLVKRSLDQRDSEDGLHSRIHFKAHGRRFDLQLVPDTSIFSKSFKAVEYDGKGEKKISVDQRNFYRGYVKGEADSFVEAHFEEGLLTAQIRTTKNTYIVEPSWRHEDNTSKFDMVVYKESDVKTNLSFYDASRFSNKPSFCGVRTNHRSKRSLEGDEEDENQFSKARRKRSVPTKNTCSVVLVADYKFFQEMGQKRTSTTVNYMISVLQRVGVIFQNTVWSSGMTGIGFEVSEVRVHSKPSGSNGPKYNKYNPNAWDIDDLLTAFSRTDWHNHCLAHLFTYQDFAKGVIGLAYVASPDHDNVGGVCSRLYNEGGTRLRYLNCGLSSSLNWGRRLLTAEADIVTAHELGHNFGADHDPDTKNCAPSESKDGKFIMYPTSVSGIKKNNKKFSPCSKSAIDKVLVSKRELCFRAKKGAFCGNFKVETNEHCDPGLEGIRNNSDPCCDSNCQFKGNAKCSDANSPCCEKCVPAPVTKKCREEFSFACTGETKCDGVSPKCPEAPKLTGPDCYGKGKCHQGLCKSFCEVNGGRKNITCICTKLEDSCKLCCSRDNDCDPITVNGTTYDLDNGHPCDAGSFQGRCLKGKCEKTKQNVLDQFLSLLKDFSASKFAKFMQENIVGSIIVFSLLVWIPASCVVHFVDKRRDKEDKEMILWRDPKNTELMRREKGPENAGRPLESHVIPRKPMYKKPVPTPRQNIGVAYT